MNRRSNAFTLIELLAVMAVVALLVGLLLPAVSHARSAADAAAALSNAKQLQTAHLTYASEHRGKVLPGYLPSGDGEVHKPGGERLGGVIAQRYTWRLMEFLNWDWRVLYYSNPFPADDPGYYRGAGSDDVDYLISVYPQFGLNSVYVGGHSSWLGFDSDYDAGVKRYGRFIVKQLSQSTKPDRQLVFASSYTARAGNEADFDNNFGYFDLVPPFIRDRNWNLESTPRRPVDTGNVMPKWDDRAAASFLDGHAAMMTVEELDDMRLWAPLARKADYRLE